MQKEKLKNILSDVQKKKISVDTALKKLSHLPYQDINFAKINHHRTLRKGSPEVIFAPGKSKEQIIKIAQEIYKKSKFVMITRLEKKIFYSLKKEIKNLKYFTEAKIAVLGNLPKPANNNYILVVSAGTADIPVAEEAAVTAQALGNKVERLYDVGVAGLHRLISNLKILEAAKVIIVVAGMEGALASVLGGMVNQPIIAVPTSVGYGASFNGLAALLTMLNSCAQGIVVVNIDNGFGAACFASLINKM